MDSFKNEEKTGVIKEYIARIREFQSNAWFYLINLAVAGFVLGVFRLLFNLYLDSLGYTEDLMGNLVSTTNLVGLFVALPVGYLIDRWSRKWAMALRILILSAALTSMALWPNVPMFYLMNAAIGLAMSMNGVIRGPFLMENSHKAERAYLFSLSMGLQNLAQFGSNYIGGYLPSWIGLYRGVDAESSTAYAGAIMISAAISLLGLIPVIMIRERKRSVAERASFDPVALIKEKPKLFGKMFTPLLLVSIGAGLFVPFLNLFFKEVHGLPDHQIGSLMAWGALSMTIGFVVAPPLAEKLGKLKFVVITQGLSIPFMILLGFVPILWPAAIAYWVRMGLMNMSNPIYQNFVLEQVEEREHATVASMYNMIWQLGRAFSPTISGYLQVSYGFGPPFAIAIGLYAVAIFMYWAFFIRGGRQRRYEEVPL